MSARGFTLLEMLIVLVIVALASATVGLALPDWRARSDLRAAAAGVERLLVRARTEALRAQLATTVQFEPEAARLGIPVLDLWQPLPEGLAVAVTGTTLLARPDAPSITFLPDGTSTGGVVTLSTSTQSRSLRVLWLTGRIDRDP